MGNIKSRYELDVAKMWATWVLARENVWRKFLKAMIRSDGIHELKKVMIGLQVGMKTASTKGLQNGDFQHFRNAMGQTLVDWFLTKQRDCEQALKNIYKKKNPNPHWHPMWKSKHDKRLLDKKRKLTEVFERWVRKESY